jgi:hypothetical protein
MSNYLYDLTRDVLSAAKAGSVIIAFTGDRPAALTSNDTCLTRQIDSTVHVRHIAL